MNFPILPNDSFFRIPVKTSNFEFLRQKSSKIKLLYIENINNPDKLLLHATSLINKGCKIAAIKAGSSSAGSRAASSHTGALMSSDAAVEALFRKAGTTNWNINGASF